MDRRLQIWLIPFGVATSISVAKPRQQVQVITAEIYAALRALFGHQDTPAAGGGTRKSFFAEMFHFASAFAHHRLFRTSALRATTQVSWFPTKARRSQLWTSWPSPTWMSKPCVR